MSGELADAPGGSGAAADGPIVFAPREDGTGLRIVDSIERRRYVLSTPTDVSPEPVPPARVGAPVDAAVRVSASAVTLPRRETVTVRRESGSPVMHAFDTARSCPPGRYLVQVTTSLKLYLAVDAPLTIVPRDGGTRIDFEERTDVVIGARSPHRRPAGTITTTADIEDLRAAVSALGSALKTTSPERSFPTLRGHPPRVELGREWAKPDYIARPDTGITIEVHRSIEDLLVAAPLAFYLGADVAWGDRQLLTDNGLVHPLSTRHGFETGVERVLKQTFLLDCLTRTEGLYPIELDEREVFEARTAGQVDFADLYDQPLARRLEAHLAVPYRALADLVPAWSGEVYVQPDPETVACLPYLLDTLSTIRTDGVRELEDWDRDDPSGPTERRDTRSVEPVSSDPPAPSHVILPESDSAVTRTWVGDGAPIGASKALRAGFEHRLERAPRTGDIRVQVVCNEPEMREERDSVREVYRDRTDHAFDVEVNTDLSVDELRAAFERDADLFHFIGHIDHQGFECRDGWFDAGTCGTVGADAFLLNSCRSVEQGEALIRNGSVGGIVTVVDLLNHKAAAIGDTFAQLLNHGFPLYAALDVVRDTYRFGDAYALLGDGHANLFQPTTTFPEYVEVKSRTEETVTVTHRVFPSHWAGTGTVICPSSETGDRYYLLGGEVATVQLSSAELRSLLERPMPLRDGADLRFSEKAPPGTRPTDR